jgi:predicted nucleic acid-binding protein
VAIYVFVETNWVFDYAVPGHHKVPEAVTLLERARARELQIHLPALCLTEARRAIMNKCEPGHEAKAIREFLKRARWERTVTPDQDRATREVLSLFERQIQAEIEQLDDVLASLRTTPGLELFSLNQHMLERAIDLGQSKLWLQPFDQAILAAVPVRAEELLALGEIDLFFCEKDYDL